MHTRTLKKLAMALTFWLAVHMSSLRAQIFTNDLPLQAKTTGTNPVDFEFRSDGTLIAKGNGGVGSLLSTDQGSGTRMLWFPDKAAFRAGSVGSYQWDSGNIGQNSVAFGSDTTASGLVSTAFGWDTSASGYFTTALGAWTTASGVFSTASGYMTSASAYASFVVGAFNVGGGNQNSWVATDPLFEIGNGGFVPPSSSYHYGNPNLNQRADALVVYKNGNATFYGSDNEMPNQTLVNSHSVLTEGLADSRYLLPSGGSGATTFTLFGGTASGSYTLALGQYANANGNNALALGTYSQAQANSTALAGGNASNSGMALGSSTASGYYSVALGTDNTSSGNYTTAMGYYNTASGNYSTASGSYTKAVSSYDFVVGTCNVGGGSSSAWNGGDPLFEVGNGGDENPYYGQFGNPNLNQPSDAFVVHKDGSAAVQGNLTAGGTITCQPSSDIPMYQPGD